ncbi:MAG TPA: divalent-cation tolerance protein CutA [Kofleriaceae bacterium]|nr:divalent-cation tolerance protein CutA [Kofleriaceae bacterium]
MATDVVVVLCTLPPGDAASSIARSLVEERLAACVNLVPQVRSFYVWQGAVEQSDELLAIIKTTVDGLAALRARLVALHPYDVPEVIALPVEDGHLPYLGWVRESVHR